MNSLIVVAGAGVLFLLAYRFYGNRVAIWTGIDPSRKTPAHELYDGVDFVPARKEVLLGHHFASIAGAAPIIGPIVAAGYGWLPVLLWIIIGGIFIGAVHDFSSMAASVRNRGGSIGGIIESEIGSRGKFFFLIFSWSTLVLVVAVFTIIVSRTLESSPEAATASIIFIGTAVIFGILLYRFKLPLPLLTVLGVIAMCGALYAGFLFPVSLPASTWVWILFGYIFTASILPVWLLLQPRDYLNSFILYALIGLSLLGIFVVRPAINLPAAATFNLDKVGVMFPMLFVTVACGAVSGFHSLVSSGTSSKQLSNERDAKFVGFGGMLIESMLAVIALVVAGMLATSDYKALAANPIELFAAGFGSLMKSLGADKSASKMFASLAISAFALTSLDTATRLARYAFQEFFQSKNSIQSRFRPGRMLSTSAGIIAAGFLVFSGEGLRIWPVFGAANQLLAALALLAVSVWLSKKGSRTLFVRIPMVFMFATTLTALAFMIYSNIQKANYPVAAASVLLFVLALFLIAEAYKALRKKA